jgi:hypothetical protein
MSTWRREAIQRIPALRDMIQKAGKPTDLWIELFLEFMGAYDRVEVVGDHITHSPEDEALIRGIYDYAQWCLLSGGPMASVAIVCFYESLGLKLFARREIPRYLTPQAFQVLDEEGILRWFVNSDEYEAFVSNYLACQRSRAPGKRGKPSAA